MSEAPQSVPAYGVGFGNYCAFLGLWLKAYVGSRGNLLRFGLYAAAIFAVCMWNARPVTIDGVEQARDTTFWATSAGAGLFSGVLFGALGAYVLSPAFIFIWQSAGYLFGPLRQANSRVTISPESVVKDASGSGTPWNAVHAVTQTRRTILIFTRPNSALIIPKSAFASPEAEQAFFSSAESWWIRANR